MVVVVVVVIITVFYTESVASLSGIILCPLHCFVIVVTLLLETVNVDKSSFF